MKSDAIAFGIAGVLFGLIAGWIIGSQQSTARPAPAAAPQQASNAPAPPAPRAPVLDETQVTALKSVAEREPKNAQPRTQLANLYFDADRYDDAIKWYDEALALGHRLESRHLCLVEHRGAGRGRRRRVRGLRRRGRRRARRALLRADDPAGNQAEQYPGDSKGNRVGFHEEAMSYRLSAIGLCRTADVSTWCAETARHTPHS